jgi:hypothetical protein
LFISNLCPRARHQHTVLLQSSAAFEGEHSAKATGFVARKELDSLWQQCTLSLSTPRSWVSRRLLLQI